MSEVTPATTPHPPTAAQEHIPAHPLLLIATSALPLAVNDSA